MNKQTSAAHYSFFEYLRWRIRVASWSRRDSLSVLALAAIGVFLGTATAHAQASILTGFSHPVAMAQDANGNTWAVGSNNQASDPYTGSLFKVNQSNTQILGVKHMGNGSAGAGSYFRLSSAIGFGSDIWVLGTNSNGTADLVQVNGSTGTTTATLANVLPTGSFPNNLDITKDASFIWVAGTLSVTRINPATLAVNTYSTNCTTTAMVADAGGHVWMTCGNAYPGHPNLVGIGQDGTVFQTATFAQSDLEDIAFDGSQVWLDDFAGKAVFNITCCGSGGVFIHQVFLNFGSPFGITSDGIDIWVTVDQAQSVFKFDGSNGTVDNILGTDASPGKPYFFGSFGLGGKIWIPDYFRGSVTMLLVPTGT